LGSDVVLTDISEERGASIFRVEEQNVGNMGTDFEREITVTGASSIPYPFPLSPYYFSSKLYFSTLKMGVKLCSETFPNLSD
jgi:hypothetical protein